MKEQNRIVVIVGSGGREDALADVFARSGQVDEVICLPGNAGIAKHARCVPMPPKQGVDALAEHIAEYTPWLVVIGPEQPLCDGLADRLRKRNIPVFGPNQGAARLEGSKAFAKDIMRVAGVPTAHATLVTTLEEAQRAIALASGPVVVKANGLCGGKGVVVCATSEEAEYAARRMLVEGQFGFSSSEVLIEERLYGEEISVLGLCHDLDVELMPAARDKKRLQDGDHGPNTGGMGSVSAPGILSTVEEELVRRQIFLPMLRTMHKLGHPFSGVLYAGLMRTKAGIRVLEFNVRFGDPETQAVLVRLTSSIVPWLRACATGHLAELLESGARLEVSPRAAVCVVQCNDFYPKPGTGTAVIHGLKEAASLPDVHIFHAGTARDEQRNFLAKGGRVLNVVALGDDVAAAGARAHDAVSCITWEGEFHRTDIAA